MKKISTLIVFTISLFFVTKNFAQPCNSIQTITCGVSNNFNVPSGAGNASYPNGMSSGCFFAGGVGGLETIYKFKATTAGLYQILTTSPTNNNSYVEYFMSNVNASNCSTTSFGCLGYTNSAVALSTISLNANDSLFFLVNSEVTTGTSQSFIVNCVIPFACKSVQNINCGDDINFTVGSGFGDPNFPNGISTSCFFNGGKGGLEKIYKFIAPLNGTYNFSTTNAATNNYVEYFYSKNATNICSASWTCFGYTNSAQTLNSVNLNVGDSLFILANAESVLGTSQNFQINCGVAYACNNITDIGCATDVQFSVGAGIGDPNIYNGLGTSCYFSSGRGGFEKVYKFKATTSGTYQLATTTASTNGYVEYFFSRNPTNVCNPAWTCLGYTNAAQSLNSFNLNAGDSLFILVNAETILGTNQNFQINCGTPLACNNIQNISCGVDIAFNVGAGLGDPNYSNGVGTSCYFSSGRGGLEKMYKFVATQSGTYQLNTTSASSNGYVEYFFIKNSTNPCNSFWTCYGYTNQAQAITSFNLNANDSLIILVNAESSLGASQNFQISCVIPFACSNIQTFSCNSTIQFNVPIGFGDPNISNGLGTTCYNVTGRGGLEKMYKFYIPTTGTYQFRTLTPTSNNTYVEYFISKNATNVCNAAWSCIGYTNAAGIINGINFNAGDSIFVLANAESSLGASQSFQFDCGTPFACTNVIPINCNQNVQFSVASGFGDVNHSNGVGGSLCYSSSGRGGFETMYRFVAPASGIYQFATTSASSNNTIVEYFFNRGGINICAALWTCIGYTSAATNLTSISLNAGETLNILANAESNLGASQSFRISCFTPLPCNNIQNITCGNSIVFNADSGFGDISYPNGLGSTCYLNSGRGGLEKIYRFVVPLTGNYKLETVSATSNSSYIEYFYKKSNLCSPSGYSCIGYTNAINTNYPNYSWNYGDTILLLVNPENINGVSQTFRINCAVNSCSTIVKNETNIIKACLSTTYKGITYKKDTTFIDVIKTNKGCDSIYRRIVITLNNFNPNFVNTINQPTPCTNNLVTQFSINTPNKPKPAVETPTNGELYIIGAATMNGWNNPTINIQAFERVDAFRYVGIFDLSGGQQYLLVPQNGSWSKIYSLSSNPLNNGLNGSFISGGSVNFVSPTISGKYKYEIDFLSGTYSLTSYTNVLPTNLFIVGAATPGGWSNPVPSNQQLTRVNSVKFEIALPLTANSGYLFLTQNGSWATKLSIPTAATVTSDSGSFYYTTSGGKDFNSPASAGFYKVEINFGNNKYRVKADSLANIEDTSYIFYNYQWIKNNLWVGSNSNTYVDSSFSKGDSVWCNVSYSTICGGSTSKLTNKVFVNYTNNPLNTFHSVSICQNQLPYVWSNQVYTTSGTYPVKWVSKNGCDSSATLILKVMDNPLITISSPNTCLSNAILSAQASIPVNQFTWLKNDTAISTATYTHSTFGNTIAGGNVAGSSQNTFNGPVGVYADANNNIYVVDRDNDRIQKWANGATQGVTVAGGYGYALTDSAFKTPTGIAFDNAGNFYVSDFGNHRVMKFDGINPKGEIVAGRNGAIGSDDYSLNGAGGVAVDGGGNVYVVDQNNHRVQKFLKGSTQGITVAGGNGQGSNANQLTTPTGIFLDNQGNVYVTDFGNRRIQRWNVGATAGITVAGGNGLGSNANQLNNPSSIFVDALQNVFVADAANNRIQKWSLGAATGVTVAGGNGLGSNPNQLRYPMGVFISNDGALIVADQNNVRIQKYNSVLTNQLTPNAIGNYSVKANGNNGCVSTSNIVNINVPRNPSISINANQNNICYGTIVNFSASVIDGGIKTDYQWYKNGVNVGTNNSVYIDSNLNNNDSVWCSIEVESGCITNTSFKSNVVYAQVNPDASGNIVTANRKPISNVNIIVTGSNPSNYFSNHKYEIKCLNSNQNFTVKLKKNNDIVKANGINSADIILTQRHITNALKLNNAYKLIAADVTGDKQINSQDILRMKRLVLGSDTTFRNTLTNENRLWVFVDSAYQFPDTTNPYTFKDSISFTNLTSNKINQSFIGVRLGDVNWDWNAAIAKQSTVDSRPSIELEVISKNENGIVNNQFSITNNQQLSSIQSTIHFDYNKYEFVGIKNNSLGVEYNATKANETGNISILWVDKNGEAKDFKIGEELFTLILRPKHLEIENPKLEITNAITESFALNKNLNKNKIVLKQLEIVNSKSEIVIYPNPSKGNITIETNGVKQISIVDFVGRELKKQIFNTQSSIYNVKLDKGIYILKAIMQNGSVKNEKLIIE